MSWIPSWLLGTDTAEEQRRADDLDARLAAMNKERLDSGAWDQSTYDEAQANLARGAVGNVDQQVNAAFVEGLNDGANNIRNTVGGAINFPFKLIPWQVYVIALVALFFYMGGAVFLKGVLKR